MEKNALINAFLNAVAGSNAELNKVVSQPPKTNAPIDINNLRPLLSNLFQIFHLSKISVDFDSHPEIAPCSQKPEQGNEPGISPDGGVELFRAAVLEAELTRSILACRIESNIDVYTLLERCTLACVDSIHPFWAASEIGGFGNLTVYADCTAVLNYTQRFANPDDWTEFIYHYCKDVYFKI